MSVRYGGPKPSRWASPPSGDAQSLIDFPRPIVYLAERKTGKLHSNLTTFERTHAHKRSLSVDEDNYTLRKVILARRLPKGESMDGEAEEDQDKTKRWLTLPRRVAAT